MYSPVQLRRSFSRHPFACVPSCKTRIHKSHANLSVTRLPDSEGIPQCKRGLTRQKRKVILYAALGIASATLYYVLVNRPSRSAPTSAPLSSTHFTPLILTASTSCTPYTKLLTFSLPSHLIPDGTRPLSSPIFSIYIKDSDIQVERPYTPLEGIDSRGQMRFWVKRYWGGEVGRWLHERKVGDLVEMRGPVYTWKWRDGEWDEVIMISGGTGITPFYQLLYSIFSPTSNAAPTRTRFTLLHSSPSAFDLPASLLGPLQSFAQSHPKLLSLRLFVDKAGPTSRPDLPRLAIGRIGRNTLDQVLIHLAPNAGPWWSRFWGPPIKLAEKKVLFLVCAPEPMTAAIAGPRGWHLTQGRVGGVLGEMGFGPHQVWKL